MCSGTKRRSRSAARVLVFATACALPAAAQQTGASTVQERTSLQPQTIQASATVRYLNPAFVAPLSEAPVARRGRPAPPLQESTVTCFDNTSSLYTYLPVAFNQEVLDWGTKTCGATGFLDGIVVGVHTTAPAVSAGGSGTEFGVCLYSGTYGSGPQGLGTLVADLRYWVPDGVVPPSNEISFFVASYLTPKLVLPDGPIGVSYYDVDGETSPLLSFTYGGACALPYDPWTGTLDCLDYYDYPAAGGGTYRGSSSPVLGEGSLYVRLDEEDTTYQAGAYFYDPYGSNPASYIATPPVLGQTWRGWVATDTSGHAFALVFGFDTPYDIQLAGGQWLFNIDGGGGEMLGLTSQPGPLAEFSFQVPVSFALIGRYVGTQAIQFGGPTPFALSNGQDLYLGTY